MGDERIGFNSDEIRQNFFSAVREAIRSKTWGELCAKEAMPKTSFENYLRGKYLLPKSIFEKLNSRLDKDMQNYFMQNIFSREASWGQSVGGKTTYAKYGHLFEFRRANGLQKLEEYRNQRSMRISSPFDVNQPLSEDLCEFLGAFIGDGFTGKYGGTYLTQFTGDVQLDRDYLLTHIVSIAKNLFKGTSAHPLIAPTKNYCRLSFYSQCLFGLLTERFEMPIGQKSHTVQIPAEIMHSNEKLMFAVIRGLWDTDGCIFYDRRAAYPRPYPRLTLQIASRPLYSQLKEFLSKYFKIYSLERKNACSFTIEIYGYDQLRRYMKYIGFSNKRHIDRIKAGGGS